MSKDQLSWEQLLNQKSDEKAPQAEPEVAPSTPTVPEPLAAAAPTTAQTTAPTTALISETVEKKSRKTRKPKSEPKPSIGLADLYAKKDWSPLEGAVAKNPPPEKMVSIPVVRSPAQIPYDEEAILNELDRNESAKSKEPTVLSVSDLNRYIKDLLEGQFAQIWLKAEISNFKAHTSGHFYFSLKDSRAQISAVMFRGYNGQLRFRPEDGMEVLVRGKITVYEPRGNYQIFCEMMEPVGAGALQKAFEQLKAKLQKEGLFDESKKRPLPALPRHIAIVTSPTGAAIRDMLNVLGRRFKGVRITVVPCKVQGDAAPGEIVEAIKLAQLIPDVDVMIVGRGGGSIEDLWAFNDERVARAIAGTRVPVISAVGHEVDFTIADFVADLRAPTPSAAAELVVKNAADLADRLRGYQRALRLALAQRMMGAKDKLGYFAKRLVDPQRKIQDASLRADELLQRLEMITLRSINDRKKQVPILSARLRGSVQTHMVRKRDALTKNMAVLDSLSPLKVLDRGFSMVMVGEKIITHAKDLAPGDTVTMRMCQGSVDATVVAIHDDNKFKEET